MQPVGFLLYRKLCSGIKVSNHVKQHIYIINAYDCSVDD